MDNSDYEYISVPLTPAIATRLIQELFAGRIVERHALVEAVIRHHREQGGLEARAKDTSRMVKKALSNMEKIGWASNPSYGQWRIKALVSNAPVLVPVLPELETPIDPVVPAPTAERVIGDGDESVYLYYFETYRRLAEAKGKTTFQCKIGRSGRDPLLRVLSQASTALPEYPTIALLLRTSDGAALEAAIHSILSLRGKEVEDAPGAEWFFTSPAEVEEIVRFIKEDPPRNAQPCPGADSN